MKYEGSWQCILSAIKMFLPQTPQFRVNQPKYVKDACNSPEIYPMPSTICWRCKWKPKFYEQGTPSLLAAHLICANFRLQKEKQTATINLDKTKCSWSKLLQSQVLDVAHEQSNRNCTELHYTGSRWYPSLYCIALHGLLLAINNISFQPTNVKIKIKMQNK